jgi:hypothetical protein
MFHWICPECGREIAPGVKECPVCDPQPSPQVPAHEELEQAVPVLIPEIISFDPEIRLREIVGRMRGMREPLASRTAKPLLELRKEASRETAPKAPAMAQRLHDAAMRGPAPAAPGRAPIRGLRLDPLGAGVALFSKIPAPGSPSRQRSLHAAPLSSIAGPMSRRITAAAPPASTIRSAAGPEWPLEGPVLPHELASLEGAGIAQVIGVDRAPERVTAGSRIPSWVMTALVAATMVAGTLSFAFYAMPGLASPRSRPAAVRPAPVLRGSPVVEVTGIRFVAAKETSPDEIRFLVVNHSAAPLDGRTIHVTLHSGAGAPVSRFTFTAAGLGAYESREMASPIQNPVPPAALPDWRDVRAVVDAGP